MQFKNNAQQEREFSMRTRMLKLAGATATVAAVVALGAGVALAAPTFTVTNGGTNLPATQVGSSTLVDGSSTLTCTGGTGKVTAANGTGLSGTGLATLSSVTFSGCTGPFSITFTVTPVGTWSLNAANSAGGTTTGTITNVDAKLSGTLCTAEVTGTVDASYVNSTGTLTVSPDGSLLTVKSASCLGVLNKGDVVKYNGKDKLNNTPYISISSP
jgi:hypothetical protein